ncbi:LacI family DNA-binding transcriptional regulator [Microbacterium sp.]|uniref:LacI family DNA-binding transcriptional regulator n=1 Tax=Microbacterium sp. TaxID=51671 RepID=UPI002811E703|nr:LacI family DNA-binding transcriptional regulator [Microbacterium sp.]
MTREPKTPTAPPGAGRVSRPTMRDVAALAGVGIKTVSRVVNGERHVSEETRQAVERAIAQLRFRRNAGAASLRQGQTSTIGLIVEDIGEPIQSNIARGVERIAHDAGTLLLTASSSDDEERERALTLSLISRRVDGLIIVPSPFDHGFLRDEADAGLPIVFADRPPVGLAADVVLADNRGGARTGTQHLIEDGHRRIAFIGDPEDVYTGAERLTGYRDALANAGLPYDPGLVFLGAPDIARCDAAVTKALAGTWPATALFTGNSLNTLATLRAPSFQRSDLAHVAFDDFELADLLRRPLTVVAQDPAAMGESAAQLVFDRLGGLEGPARTVVLPTTLIAR